MKAALVQHFRRIVFPVQQRVCVAHTTIVLACLEAEVKHDGSGGVEAEVLHRGKGRHAAQEEREEVRHRRVCEDTSAGGQRENQFQLTRGTYISNSNTKHRVRGEIPGPSYKH